MNIYSYFCKCLINILKTMYKLLVALFLITMTLSANDKTMFVGIGAGPLYGVNETATAERSLGFDLKANAVYTNLLGPYISLELGVAYGQENHNKDIPSWFKTDLLMGDLRARFYFLSFLGWNVSPYVYGGVGVVNYNSTYDPNAHVMPGTTKPNFAGNNISGTDFMYNIGGGISYTLNKDWAIDVAAGPNFSMNDNINPWLDDVNDAFWTAYVTVSYNVGDVFNLNGSAYSNAEEYESNVGDNLVLEGVNFKTDSSELLPESEMVLYRALKTLKNNDDWNVEIVGYTDNTGDRQYNIDLSLKRAETVKNWLVNNGIEAERITTKGLGPDNPLFPNDTPENRAKNRRIEFVRTK